MYTFVGRLSADILANVSANVSANNIMSTEATYSTHDLIILLPIKLGLTESVFSYILSMTGKINFETGKAILLPVEFSRIPCNFKQ